MMSPGPPRLLIHETLKLFFFSEMEIIPKKNKVKKKNQKKMKNDEIISEHEKEEKEEEDPSTHKHKIDRMKKLLHEQTKKYEQLLRYSRYGATPLTSATKDQYPKETKEIDDDETSFYHGFNSGALAMIRHVSEMFYAEEHLKCSNQYIDSDEEEITLEAYILDVQKYFPFLDL